MAEVTQKHNFSLVSATGARTAGLNGQDRRQEDFLPPIPLTDRHSGQDTENRHELQGWQTPIISNCPRYPPREQHRDRPPGTGCPHVLTTVHVLPPRARNSWCPIVSAGRWAIAEYRRCCQSGRLCHLSGTHCQPWKCHRGNERI